MIISHKHRFIFIKTEKTAGTSIEIALSKFCGPEDVITPISSKDETMRQQLGYRGPQNFHVPLSSHSRLEVLSSIYRRKRLEFYNHAAATYIRSHIDRETWDGYYKFCFERNPWDKVVSYYFWRNADEPRPPISEFIQAGKANNILGFELYTIQSELAVDRVFFYEQLAEAMEEIRDRIGLPETPALPHAKAGHRKDRRSYRDILSAADRDKIHRVYAREIAYFDYKW